MLETKYLWNIILHSAQHHILSLYILMILQIYQSVIKLMIVRIHTGPLILLGAAERCEITHKSNKRAYLSADKTEKQSIINTTMRHVLVCFRWVTPVLEGVKF